MLSRLLSLLVLAAGVASCATGVQTEPDTGVQKLAFQNPALNPRNGGLSVKSDSVRPGDLILSSSNGISSVGIRLLTLSPVSHASIYTGDQQVAEAVGHGIRRRSVAELLEEESTVVAFRHPGVQPEHARKMEFFVQRHLGQKYNFVGVMLQAPFSIERRMCEMPLVPSLVRDFCVQGVAAVQLGMGRNDQFFCSQFVLEAYAQAGLPLTAADPRLFSPGDLLHMARATCPRCAFTRPCNTWAT
jgi:hypothetical protein